MTTAPSIRQALVSSSILSIKQQASPSAQSPRFLNTHARPNQASETKSWLGKFEDNQDIVPPKILQCTWERDGYAF